MPVEAFNTRPRNPAYTCYPQDYPTAEKLFYAAYIKGIEEFGQWEPLTVARLNNWIVAIIKRQQCERAEKSCTFALNAMKDAGLGDSSSFICVQCSLCSSLFLSGQIVDAEALFANIAARLQLVGSGLARDFFEVLHLVRITWQDCLVFRQCGITSPILIPVVNYIDQFEGVRSKKNTLKSSFGSLKRVASFVRLAGKSDQSGESNNPPERSGSLKTKTATFDFGFSRVNSRSASLLNVLTENSPSIEPESKSMNGAVDAARHEATSKVDDGAAGWLQHQHAPLPPVFEAPNPSVMPRTLDPALEYTDRSTKTTASSIRDSKPRFQLEIDAWAAERHEDAPKHLFALLDTGAFKSCASEGFAAAIRAPIEPVPYRNFRCANYSEVEVLGKIKVRFSWRTPAGTQFNKIACYVVKDLSVGMIICQGHIEKLKLLDSPSFLAAVLFGPRSQQAKRNDELRSKQIAAEARAIVQHNAAVRKVERANMEAMYAGPAHPKSKSLESQSNSSHVGSSATYVDSKRSDLTRSNLSALSHSRTNISTDTNVTATTSSRSISSAIFSSRTTTPIDRVVTATTSMESVRSPQRNGSLGHRRSDAVYQSK